MRRTVDLEAIVCLDIRHRWSVLRQGRSELGFPVRVVSCDNCHSQRTDLLTWDGRVVSRYYDHDPAYMENSRKLGDTFSERQTEYRRLMLKGWPKK